MRKATVALGAIPVASLLAPLNALARNASDVPDPVPKPAPTQTQEQVSLVKRYGLEESKIPVRERAGWKSPRKVLVWNRAPQLLPTLQSAAPGVELIPAANEAEAVRLVADADAVIGFAGRVPPQAPGSGGYRCSGPQRTAS